MEREQYDEFRLQWGRPRRGGWGSAVLAQLGPRDHASMGPPSEGRMGPAWLGSCVHCGRSKRVVSYRGGGLCKACVRTATVEERRLAGLRFRALKPRKPHPDAIYQEMVREVVMAHGWAAVARVVGTTTQAVKRWANQRNYVPHRFRAKLRRMWEGA